MPKSKTITTKKSSVPSWDLSDLFSSPEDPKLKKTLDDAKKRAKKFRDAHRGKIADLAQDPEEFADVLREYEDIFMQASKPEIYAYLRFTADTSKPEHGAFLQKMRAEGQVVMQDMLFFELELVKLDKKEIKALMAHPACQNYAHYLEKQEVWKDHRLSEPEENILMQKGLTGSSAFVRLYDQIHATQHYHFKEGKETKELNASQIHAYARHPKRALRKEAARAFTEGLKESLSHATFITNILAQDKQTDDKLRKFDNPELPRHLSNEITQDVVNSLRDAVVDSYPLVQDFYRFKKKLLKLDKLYDYDRYAPIASAKRQFSYDEAKRIILTAYGKFSPVFEKTAREFFDGGWIDAVPRSGKRGGAYCMYVTPDIHPYIFTNFTGELNDVLTLAHELGHGIHASLGRKQTYLNFDVPLTTAETASIFGEMLVFNDLRNSLTNKKDKLALYVYKIENIFASIHRQLTMYRFEQELHKTIREKGEQSPEQIGKIWMKYQKEMFGNSVTLTPDYEAWWSYISHFVHSPFYVYAYAFGELLTLSLFAQYQKKGTAIADAYTEMLSAAGSKSPDELVKIFGIDLTDKKFWRGGMEIVAEMIKEAKALAK